MPRATHSAGRLRRSDLLQQSCASFAAASLVASLSGCGVDFDSVAQLDGLRVLAVQKSAPYGVPGGDVNMKMLYHDDAEEERDTQILWLRGCRNPPADLVQLCFEAFEALLKQADDVPPPPRGEPSQEDLAALLESLQSALDPERLIEESGIDPAEVGGGDAAFGSVGIGFGEEFELTVDPDIISSRPPPLDPLLPPYGLEYVLFLACAGQLWVEPDAEGFPVRCYDEDADLVGSDRFIVGYTALYVYDDIQHRNPVISGIQLDGDELEDDQFCLNDDCQTLSPEDDEDADCQARLDTCEDEDVAGDCPKLPFQVLVDPDSVDEDVVLGSLRDTDIGEQMWVNYYTDHGSFSFDVALVNDAQSGFNEDTETEFIAPEEPGVAHVWAVVRDNRGGAAWSRFEICVED